MKETILIIAILVIVVCLMLLRIVSFKDWLLWAVVEAEDYLGSGTGALKLQYAYDLAVKQFPIIAKFMTLKLFNVFVKKALRALAELIENNGRIAAIFDKREGIVDGTKIE